MKECCSRNPVGEIPHGQNHRACSGLEMSYRRFPFSSWLQGQLNSPYRTGRKKSRPQRFLIVVENFLLIEEGTGPYSRHSLFFAPLYFTGGVPVADGLLRRSHQRSGLGCGYPVDFQMFYFRHCIHRSKSRESVRRNQPADKPCAGYCHSSMRWQFLKLPFECTRE